MKRKFVIILIVIILGIVAGVYIVKSNMKDEIIYKESNSGEKQIIEVNSNIRKIENGLSYVKYDGDYYFDNFINQGGATSDSKVVEFLMNNLKIGKNTLGFNSLIFGCSTIATKNEKNEYVFGRNFDWNRCNAMVVLSNPTQGLASISTVNMDFVSSSSKAISLLPDETKAMVALYAPLDGMNEKGLVVSVNMIQDSSTINQNTTKPDITTTTAIRLLLNKAENVDQALNLLKQYDMHASMGYMVHFAMADTTGRSVVVEYINNDMKVIETPIVTNFYLAEGEKYGIGTSQSHTRYEILQNIINNNKTLNEEQVKDALSSVSKGNFGEFESTEWSIVFNQNTKEATYYHRENYNNSYSFKLGD